MAEKPDDSGYDFAPQQPAPQDRPTPTAEEPDASPPLDRICPNCGFRVIGKTARNRCPECTGDLAASAERFQFSSPAWLRTLSSGILLLIPSLLLNCIALTLSWLHDEPAAGASLYLIAAICGLVGTWLATLPDRTPNAPLFPAALPVRILALLVTLLAAALAFPAQAHLSASAIIILLLIALAALSVALALHLRTLALRIPNDSLMWWSQSLVWLLPLCILAHIMLHVTLRAKAEFMMLFMCATPMAGGFCAIALAALITLLRFALELRTCASTSEDIVLRRAQRAEADAKRDAARKSPR